MGIIKNKKGSLTVEAALSLPIFMALILLIVSISRVYFIHEVVQDALSDAVNEVAATAYIYEIVGATGLRNDIRGTIKDKAEAVQGDVDLFLDLVDISKDTSENIVNLDLGQLESNFVAGSSTAGELDSTLEESIKDPRSYAKSILAAGLDLGAKKGEEAIMSFYIKALMKKHLETSQQTADERLLNANIKDGFSGLSFKGSTYFDGNEEIDVYITYTFDRIDPFGFIKDVTLSNHVRVRGWINGEGNSKELEEAKKIKPLKAEPLEEEVEEETENPFSEAGGKDGSGDNIEEKEKWESGTVYITNKYSKVFHTNKTCGGNMGNAKLESGEILDVPGWINDRFELDGKIYNKCQRCGTGLFNE